MIGAGTYRLVSSLTGLVSAELLFWLEPFGAAMSRVLAALAFVACSLVGNIVYSRRASDQGRKADLRDRLETEGL